MLPWQTRVHARLIAGTTTKTRPENTAGFHLISSKKILYARIKQSFIDWKCLKGP